VIVRNASAALEAPLRPAIMRGSNLCESNASAWRRRRFCGVLADEKFHRGDLVLKRSRERRAANNKSARCALKNTVRRKKEAKTEKSNQA